MSAGRRSGERRPRQLFGGHTGRHVPAPPPAPPAAEPAPDAGPAPCGCPQEAGVIRHLKQICTDPVVDHLGWYASQLKYCSCTCSGCSGCTGQLADETGEEGR